MDGRRLLGFGREPEAFVGRSNEVDCFTEMDLIELCAVDTDDVSDTTVDEVVGGGVGLRFLLIFILDLELTNKTLANRTMRF